jgi:hypothetical protein
MFLDNARCVHDQLMVALERLRLAEQSAVTLFARVLHEDLFRSLGYATIELYGQEGLNLSVAKTRQFVRLAKALDCLPATRHALDDGSLSWTKARTITSVATPRTEAHWISTATKSTSRELETHVSRARKRNQKERDRLRHHRGQAAMVLPDTQQIVVVEAPVTISITLTPVQHARYEALVERLRKQGHNAYRSDLILESMESLVQSRGPRETASSPYHITAYTCDTCNKTSINGRCIAPATAEAMTCDAVQISPQATVPNKATIPPSTRRAVLIRDHHRCTTPNCNSTHFLEVHHRTPRHAGGSNHQDNLTTLCSACHRFTHEHQPKTGHPKRHGLS